MKFFMALIVLLIALITPIQAFRFLWRNRIARIAPDNGITNTRSASSSIASESNTTVDADVDADGGGSVVFVDADVDVEGDFLFVEPAVAVEASEAGDDSGKDEEAELLAVIDLIECICTLNPVKPMVLDDIV